MDFKNIVNAAISTSGKPDLSLSGDSLKILDELIAKGNFKDQSDFTAFATKVYTEYRLSGNTADIKKAAEDAGKAKGMNTQDIEGKLVPLLTSVFTSMGKNKMGF